MQEQCQAFGLFIAFAYLPDGDWEHFFITVTCNNFLATCFLEFFKAARALHHHSFCDWEMILKQFLALFCLYVIQRWCLDPLSLPILLYVDTELFLLGWRWEVNSRLPFLDRHWFQYIVVCMWMFESNSGILIVLFDFHHYSSFGCYPYFCLLITMMPNIIGQFKEIAPCIYKALAFDIWFFRCLLILGSSVEFRLISFHDLFCQLIAFDEASSCWFSAWYNVNIGIDCLWLTNVVVACLLSSC